MTEIHEQNTDTAAPVDALVVRKNSRYPYTYCADYLRMEIGDDYGKGLPSRAAMARAKALIAEAIGMNEEELASRVADKYIDKYGA
jgi:hypothetical protein